MIVVNELLAGVQTLSRLASWMRNVSANRSRFRYAALTGQVFLGPVAGEPELADVLPELLERGVRNGPRRHPLMVPTVYSRVYRPGSTRDRPAEPVYFALGETEEEPLTSKLPTGQVAATT